jgi:hypothetical protein
MMPFSNLSQLELVLSLITHFVFKALVSVLSMSFQETLPVLQLVPVSKDLQLGDLFYRLFNFVFFPAKSSIVLAYQDMIWELYKLFF